MTSSSFSRSTSYLSLRRRYMENKYLYISIRGYIGLYLYADKKTGKLMPYFVKSKSEWLQTLKDCTNEYGPGANIKSKKLLHLLTDYNSEVQSTESTEYLKENQIKLFSSTPYKHAQNLIERFVQSIFNMLRVPSNTSTILVLRTRIHNRNIQHVMQDRKQNISK